MKMSEFWKDPAYLARQQPAESKRKTKRSRLLNSDVYTSDSVINDKNPYKITLSGVPFKRKHTDNSDEKDSQNISTTSSLTQSTLSVKLSFFGHLIVEIVTVLLRLITVRPFCCVQEVRCDVDAIYVSTRQTLPSDHSDDVDNGSNHDNVAFGFDQLYRQAGEPTNRMVKTENFAKT